VADSKNEDHHFLVLNFANDAEIADAVSPVLAEF